MTLPSQERQDIHTQTRILNDAELLKGGARIAMGEMVVTEEQRQEAQRAMLYDLWRDARLYSKEPRAFEDDTTIHRDDLVNFAIAAGLKTKQANMAWTAINPNRMHWLWNYSARPLPDKFTSRALDKADFLEATGLRVVEQADASKDADAYSAKSLLSAFTDGRLDGLDGLGPDGRALLADVLSYKMFEQAYLKTQAKQTSTPELATVS